MKSMTIFAVGAREMMKWQIIVARGAAGARWAARKIAWTTL